MQLIFNTVKSSVIEQMYLLLGFTVTAISWFEMSCLHMAFGYFLSIPVNSRHAGVAANRKVIYKPCAVQVTAVESSFVYYRKVRKES